MIPFFWLGYLNLGFIQVAWFYVFVASAVLVGYLIGRWRARRVGLESGLLTQMALVSVLTGFAGSHGIAVLLEAPALVRKNPLMLLQLWRGMSSLGGIVSGLIGLAWVGWRRGLS